MWEHLAQGWHSGSLLLTLSLIWDSVALAKSGQLLPSTCPVETMRYHFIGFCKMETVRKCLEHDLACVQWGLNISSRYHPHHSPAPHSLEVQTGEMGQMGSRPGLDGPSALPYPAPLGCPFSSLSLSWHRFLKHLVFWRVPSNPLWLHEWECF